MKKFILVFALLLTFFCVSAKAGFFATVSQEDEIVLTAVQSTKSLGHRTGYELVAGVSLKPGFSLYGFGGIEYLTELKSFESFSKLGDLPGLSFGLGVCFRRNVFFVDGQVGVEAFYMDWDRYNCRAMLLLKAAPGVEIQIDGKLSACLACALSLSASATGYSAGAGLKLGIRLAEQTGK